MKALASFEELRNSYIAALDKKPNSYFWAGQRKPSDEIADKMFKTIFESKYPSDWLRQNQTLREVCKTFGMVKSGELREFVKDNWVAIDKDMGLD